MDRRSFLGTSLAMMFLPHASAEFDIDDLETAGKLLADAARQNEVLASALFVQQKGDVFSRAYGTAPDTSAMFLLASISKTISIAAVMTLFDEGAFKLDDPAQKYLSEFRSEGRERITMRQLMTHCSGLPDQLPENNRLRAAHSPLEEFVKGSLRTPLLFAPGTQYSYSSMAILLATEVARRISGKTIAELTQERIYKPLGMKRSAMGLGFFDYSEVVLNQTDRAAPDLGAGDPNAKSWDWNSPYWRNLGAPWGTAHGSAEDVGKFLQAFLYPNEAVLKAETIKLMTTNQNPPHLRPRGLGFDLGQIGGTPLLSDGTYGHTGSTGTICWADPATDTICVILTTLPHRAASPHPRDIVSARVAETVHSSKQLKAQ